MTYLTNINFQSNEVPNSSHMELEGLKRNFQNLQKNHGFTVSTLITDRHTQVRKHVRENEPHVNHFFDGWHLVKGK